jgi:hypothetical protein
MKSIVLLLGLFAAAALVAATEDAAPEATTDQSVEEIEKEALEATKEEEPKEEEPAKDDESKDDDEEDGDEESSDLAEDELPSEKVTESQMADLDDSEDEGVRCQTCYAVGDPHFRSFDGQYFHFQGVGGFRLAKCKNFEVQGRTKVCGKHRYYGVVACYDEAAVKYTNPVTKKTSVVQVNTRNTRSIKIDGKTVGFNTNHFLHTAAGQTVSPQVLTGSVYDARRKRFRKWTKRAVVVSNGKDNSQMIIHSYGIYIRAPINDKCTGLCGNDNGRPADDYRDAKGKLYTNIRTRADKVGNHRNKPLHKWGETFMVKSKSNPSGVPDLIDGPINNKPQYRPGQAKFPDTAAGRAAAARVKACCKKAGFFNYEQYRNCVLDGPEMGSQEACRVGAMANVEEKKLFAKMSGNGSHKNKHWGKLNIVKILKKMDIEFKEERDRIKDAIMREEEDVAKHKSFYVHAARTMSTTCGAVRPMAHHTRRAIKAFEIARGIRQGALNYLNKMLPGWINDLKRIANENALIKQMLALVERLRGVKSLSELDIDHKTLNELPKLKETFQALIDRSHDDRNGNNGASEVRRLLLSLIADLTKEERTVKNHIFKARRNLAINTKKMRHAHRVMNIAKRHLARQQRICRRWRGQHAIRRRVYTAKLRDQQRNLRQQRGELRDLGGEIDMVKHLTKIVVNWSNKKRAAGKSPCESEETEDIEVPTEEETEEEPVEDIEEPVEDIEEPAEESEEFDEAPVESEAPSAEQSEEEPVEDVQEEEPVEDVQEESEDVEEPVEESEEEPIEE